MKKLSMVCMLMLVVLSAGQAFALPGVYKAGASSMTLNIIGPCETRTISLDGTGFGTSPLMAGGFFILNGNDDVVEIADCRCYDGTLTPAIWDPPGLIVFDPGDYPGSLFVAMGKLVTGIIPSADILLCDVTFCGVGYGTTIITIDIDPDPTYDMWVAQDYTVYDPTIDAAVINVTATSWHCECAVSGPLEVQAHVSGDPVTATYTASPGSGCDNPPIYIYSDDCVHGSIDPGTGLFTVPAFTTPAEENCTITVTDTANTDFNSGDPIVCTLDISILAGDGCEGNFDCDQDQDSSDAATFKTDFGRSNMSDPCTNELPCNGDFNCDRDVDSSDAAQFKTDFGRSNMKNPCPICEVGARCAY